MGTSNLDALELSGALTVTGAVSAVGALSAPQAIELAPANGAISLKAGVVLITKGTAAAMTLAAPTTGTDDGKVLHIVSTTDAAHTVTQTAPGYNSDSTSGDVATYGAAAGNALTLVAYGGVWYTVNAKGVTIA